MNNETTGTKPGTAAAVSVCVTCRAIREGEPPPGPALLSAIETALTARSVSVQVRPVQCLSVCQRSVTIAVSSPGGYSFLFGDLDPIMDADTVAQFVAAYCKADLGFVPWRERPERLRKRIVARIPPLSWSPEDGRAPA